MLLKHIACISLNMTLSVMGLVCAQPQNGGTLLLHCRRGLLIEMQGQGHSTRPVTKANSTEGSLAERKQRDWLYAEEAMRQGWSVLWLWVDEAVTSRDAQAALWAQQLQRAMAHVKARHAPQLFVA